MNLFLRFLAEPDLESMAPQNFKEIKDEFQKMYKTEKSGTL